MPLTKIGRDVDFADLATSWGFSAVVLAHGAWRDRPLPVEGADDFVGRGGPEEVVRATVPILAAIA